MRTQSSQAGSHVLAFAIAILAVAVIGFAGYRVWQMQTAAPSSTSTVSGLSVPAKITNKATLDQAASALDKSSTTLNSNLNDTTLNTYLKALL